MLEELEEKSGLGYEDGRSTVCSVINNGLGRLKGRDSLMWITHLIAEMTTLKEHIQTKEIEIWRLGPREAEKKKAALGLYYNP
eukprot:27827-Eustigmatos_ZCMA.PRE.1